MEQTASWNAGFCVICGALVKSWEARGDTMWQCQNLDCENHSETESFMTPPWVK